MFIKLIIIIQNYYHC